MARQNQANGQYIVSKELGSTAKSRRSQPTPPPDDYGYEDDVYDEPVAPQRPTTQRRQPAPVQAPVQAPIDDGDDMMVTLLEEGLGLSDEIGQKVGIVVQSVSGLDTRMKAMESVLARVLTALEVLPEMSETILDVSDAVLDADSALGTFVNVAHLREDARDLRELVKLQEEMIGELVALIGIVPTSVMTSPAWTRIKALQTSIHERGITFGAGRYAQTKGETNEAHDE